jgi:hypothetical protein
VGKKFLYKTGTRAGQPVPKGVPVFTEDEELDIKGWRWKVTLCSGKKLILESVGPIPKPPKRERTKNQKRKR